MSAEAARPNRHGHAPALLAFGYLPATLPDAIADDDKDELGNFSRRLAGDAELQRKYELQAAAGRAMLEAEAEESIKRATGGRPRNDHLEDFVLRRAATRADGPLRRFWAGPGTFVAAHGHNWWIDLGGRFLKAAAESVRHAVPEEPIAVEEVEVALRRAHNGLSSSQPITFDQEAEEYGPEWVDEGDRSRLICALQQSERDFEMDAADAADPPGAVDMNRGRTRTPVGRGRSQNRAASTSPGWGQGEVPGNFAPITPPLVGDPAEEDRRRDQRARSRSTARRGESLLDSTASELQADVPAAIASAQGLAQGIKFIHKEDALSKKNDDTIFTCLCQVHQLVDDKLESDEDLYESVLHVRAMRKKGTGPEKIQSTQPQTT